MKLVSLPVDARNIFGTYYYVDPRGLVYSHRRLVSGKFKTVERIQHMNPKGYMQVRLNGKTYTVHRLVATAFIPKSSPKPQVNHIDSNRANNDVSNLEWVTHQENMDHAKAKGAFLGYHGAGRPQRKLLQLNPDGSLFKEHASLKDAAIAMTGNLNSRPAILKAVNGERKSYRKYLWAYA